MSEHFIIEGLAGERALSGSIPVRGAKNAVLKSMAATVLFDDTVTITNVPGIEDVGILGDMLADLGAHVEKTDDTYTIDTAGISKTEFDFVLAKKLRASIVLSGPLLARFGRVAFPHPGGDIIGPRPINFFLEGFQKMGAEITKHDDHYVVTSNGKLTGAEIFFTFVSVTATESLMMAATLAEGTTVLRNAAMEPEIVALAEHLVSCGANISGAGSPNITITGGGMLKSSGKVWRTIPDRIEAGSFLLLGALAAHELEITDCDPTHLEMLIALLRESGVVIDTTPTSIKLRRADAAQFHALTVRTHEYPGFATDLQPPMVVYLTQAHGTSSVFETIWGGRLLYTKDLVRMGAKIDLLNPQQVKIEGPTPFVATELESPDIRAGLAFLMSAAIAKGTSTVGNIYHIDRGYERIEGRLQKLGLNIKRVTP
ncbi:MAG TPA: UDP-N-acetylglucosamine 1-carboxyvinyltransferase [Candidatus Paceibacterota bacterium]